MLINGIHFLGRCQGGMGSVTKTKWSGNSQVGNQTAPLRHVVPRFFLGKGAHQRKQSFCSDRCRFAFNRKRRTKETQAAYMKRYRAERDRRARNKKRRVARGKEGRA